MGKSQQSFNKRKREEKRLKKREEKRKKMEARRAEAKESGKKGIEFAYVDYTGNLRDTPPDPSNKVEIEAEDIVVGIPKTEKSDADKFDPVRQGTVTFFDSSKGFGFIVDDDTQEKHFTHVTGIIDDITENDKVSFELKKGLKGMNAVEVRKL